MSKSALKKLAGLLAPLLLLQGCVGPGVGSESESTETEITTTTYPVPSEDYLTLVDNGNVMFNVVSHDLNIDEMQKAATEFYNDLCSASMSVPKFLNDTVAPEQGKIEVIFGKTVRELSADLYSSIDVDEYGYRVQGNQILVYGTTLPYLKIAASEFLKLVRNNAKANANGKVDILIKTTAAAKFNSKEAMSFLPKYDFENTPLFCDAGDGTGLFVIDKSSPAEFNAYTAFLTAEGFTPHAANKIKENLFATFVNADIIVDVWYIDYSGELRITATPANNFSPVPKKSAEDHVKTVSPGLTLFSGKGSSESDYNQLMLFTLEDGTFIVMDGAWGTGMFDLLHAEMKRHAKNPENIVIRAWIFTHSHPDHIGAFREFAAGYSQYKNTIKLESLIYNFAGEEQAGGKSTTLLTTDIIMRGLFSTANFKNTTKYIPHPGNVFYFPGMKIEIAGTPESFISPKRFPEPTSKSCMSMKITVNGQTIFINGDNGVEDSAIIGKTYGDYLKCDILQASHHGGADGGVAWVNELFAPSVSIFLCTSVLWEKSSNFKKSAWNQAILNNPNFKEAIVYKERGQVIYMPLPYTPGSSVVR